MEKLTKTLRRLAQLLILFTISLAGFFYNWEMWTRLESSIDKDVLALKDNLHLLNPS